MADPRRYGSATAFRSALEDRLRQWSTAERADIQRLRRQVAFDRLLARLFGTAGAPWALKGGYGMELRVKAARATKDIDLVLRDRAMTADEGASLAVQVALQEAAAKDLGDFFEFQIGEPVMDLEAVPYGGARYPASALMDSRVFTTFHLDVAFGDEVLDPLEMVEGRDWLSFAGLGCPAFPAISKEQQFAEKLHAYSLPRGSATNSRVKDLVDLVLLIDSGLMQPDRLLAAFEFTFRRRATHPIPDRLEGPPADWAGPFAALARECGLDQGDASSALALVGEFFEALRRP